MVGCAMLTRQLPTQLGRANPPALSSGMDFAPGQHVHVTRPIRHKGAIGLGWPYGGPQSEQGGWMLSGEENVLEEAFS